MSENKVNKQNISVSLHLDILKLIEDYCEINNLKKSKFIEGVIKEYFKK